MSIYGRMVKFEHSILALPFTLTALLLAHRVTPVTPRLVFLIIMAVVWARSAAMGFNRLVDAPWDAHNPRTSMREIPAGNISNRETIVFVYVSSFLFSLSALAISLKCFWFSFPVLLVLFSYSYTKRFTWLSHLVLGFGQALAPLGVWLAVTGELSLKISILSITLATYMAGLDILYACQDIECDRRDGLFSLPANLGIKRALGLSVLMHTFTFISLLALYWAFGLSPFFLLFVIIIGGLLIAEHRLVTPNDLTHINFAFFHINTAISLLLLAAMFVEELIRKIPPL